MFVSAVYIRFFRSFNFDYLRKASTGFNPDPWDLLEPGGLQYPFVKIPLEYDITTVVGANESGKSQLLSAVKHALTGQGVERGDFCRYSQFFAVNKSMAFPDFGVEIKNLRNSEREVLKEACGDAIDSETDCFTMFRVGNTDPVIYIRDSGEWKRFPVKDQKSLGLILPQWFEIDAHIALPESVPLEYLARGSTSWRTGPRKSRQGLVNLILDNAPDWFLSPESINAAGPKVVQAYNEATPTTTNHDRQLKLADELLLKVAQIDRTAFQELLKAADAARDGFANGIVEQMNKALASSLNFPKWWSQDHQFQLRLTLRDQDLVFTIRDRTGTEYSADERSGGLKYFLSYFVQYLAHKPSASGVREILLMDEPDAYLSSTGQQDLLRIFEDFAHPQDGSRVPCQVIYVTHSPFLIDKNHGDRIRVLEKGEGDEGTRVVKNAARNHYEPLRSAFGSFVAETTFISNCNLMLEGPSDQVLIAGMSTRMRRQTTSALDNLDLNTITLVPAGGAENIPYMAYLARGRDVDRPAVIVLLDSDESGNKAFEGLCRGPKGKPVIKEKFVLRLGALQSDAVSSTFPNGVVAIEDLIPLEIGIAAVKLYADQFLHPDEAARLHDLGSADVSFDQTKGTHDALEKCAATKLPGFHLDKVGFARSVLDVIREVKSAEFTDVLDSNFRVLFRELGRRQRDAMREITVERTSSKIKRLKRSFLLDHPSTATREEATLLLEEIDSQLDNSVDSEELRNEILKVRRKFDLDDDPVNPIENFDDFRGTLDTLAYQRINDVQDA